jgi:hypothetical protein
MSARVFALIIGIDSYKSGSIWNLESATSDAKSIKHWLVHHLGVPRHQIRTLLDSEATTTNIQDAFTSHLLDNPAIVRGDAILIYWAGHGSSLLAPRSLSGSSSARGYSHIDVLVTYDHDTKNPAGSGRISGISDRCMYSMMRTLSAAKGDNITLALDVSFSAPTRSQNRGNVRWTPTVKATAEDVLAGLWRVDDASAGEGFFHTEYDTHTLLVASGPREGAVEGNDGGRFTQSLIRAAGALPLHQTSYIGLISHMTSSDPSFGENHDQTPRSLGLHKSRIIFHALPFIADERYIALDAHPTSDHFRIEMGSVHGIVKGTELSMHSHNRRGSLNPALDRLKVSEVHATWSLARRRSRESVHGEWAQITQRTPSKPKAYLRKHLPFGHAGGAGRAIQV